MFEPEQDADRPAEQTEVQYPVPSGAKYIPQVRIEQTHAHNNGRHMEIRCHIKNESHQKVELDKIYLLGQKRELDTWLRPEESKEFIVYSGERPNNRSYDTVDLNYKNELSDYFQTKCHVEFRQESDNTYSVYRITHSGGVKDIQ